MLSEGGDALMRRFTESRRRRRATGALAVCAVLAAVLATVVGSAWSATSSNTIKAVAPKKCGDVVAYPKTDPDGILKKMPATVQNWYKPYPFEVRATPWTTFKGKSGPWTVGYISFPIANPWKVNFLQELKKEFAAAKAQGLVSGSLREYIQPDSTT